MKKLLAIIFFSTLAIAYFMPIAAFAQKSYCWPKQDCDKANGIYTETPESKKDCVQSPVKYNFCFPKEAAVKLQVNIGTLTQASSLTQYIPAVYNYLVSIVSIVAIIMIMVGGLRYLTAGGNPSAITSAKETILGAVIGLFLTLGSYVILQTINPALTTLSLPPIKMVAPQSLAQWCRNDGEFQGKFKCGEKYTPSSKEKPPINSGYCMGSACTTAGEGCYSGTILPLRDAPKCFPDVFGKLIKALETKASACNGTISKQLSGGCSSMIIFSNGQINNLGLKSSPTFMKYVEYYANNTPGFLSISENEFIDFSFSLNADMRVELCAEVTLASKNGLTCEKNKTAIVYVVASIGDALANKDKKFLDAIAGPLGVP